jgi:hypothetical protein
MNVRPIPPISRGWSVYGSDGRLLGQVDAVFADYLLVRTASLPPVDLYVPVSAVGGSGNGRVALTEASNGAYQRWHRPLKRAPHG